MEKKKKILVFLCGIFIATSPIYSQVTIGAGKAPETFSLLELVSGNNKGLRLPQIESTAQRDSIFTNADGFKENTLAQGLKIFNMQTKCAEYWNGTSWNTMWGETAANGLTLANDTIVLGGTLNRPTTIDLNSNNLIFTRGTGKVGIGTTSPQASLHLIDEMYDSLIIDSLKFTSDPPSSPNDTVYYNMQISNKGVVRKAQNVNNHHSGDKYIYTLTALSPEKIAVGDTNGNNGSQFHWTKNEQTFDYITLPEDGAYVFNFRLYGTSPTGTTNTTSFYLTAFINSMTKANLADAQEIIITMQNSTYAKATYSAFLTLAGKANDKIYFKIGEVSGRTLNWTLLGTTTTGITGITESSSNRTSMIFWKI